MVSHPETGSDSPIGSDRGRGRDKSHFGLRNHILGLLNFFFFLKPTTIYN